MISIEQISIGNSEIAYIEKHFSEGINLIYSNDNNKGKTIVAQGLYYALGNNPIFPSGFDYKNYYFIIDLNVNGEKISICRKNDFFVTKIQKHLNMFDGVTEFKRFFNKKIYKLPQIVKDNRAKMVDLELFFQLFFVGQDCRNTSNIFNSGYNKKEDFENLIYSMLDCYKFDTTIDENEIKQQIINLNNEKNILIKQNKILKKNISEVNIATYTRNKEAVQEKLKITEQIKNELVELNNERNRINNKMIKNEILLKELRSLNRTLDEGQLVCLDCKSNHIGFENKEKDFQFDVSDSEIRNDIINIVKERIDINKEEIEKVDTEIFYKQTELKNLLKDSDITLENLLLYKQELENSSDADTKIASINKEIENLDTMLHSEKINNDNIINLQKNAKNNILKEMMEIYNKIDPEGNLVFNDIFTKRDQNYSGSEGSEYYISKLFAFAKILKHPFPIVIDAFREGELSTPKEKIVIDNFQKLPNQVIFTATLKQEEYNKYENFKNITKMDYSNIRTCHLLNSLYAEDMKKSIKSFSINID